MHDDLSRLVGAAALLGEVTGCRMSIIGGIARGVWASPRATLDVDVLFDAPTVALAVAHAGDAGLVAVPSEVAALTSAGMTRLRLPDRLTGATRLDVITADHPYYVRVIDRSQRIDLAGHSILVGAPEDIILLKTLADRSQDRADIEAIVAARGSRLDLGLMLAEARLLELDLARVVLDGTRPERAPR